MTKCGENREREEIVGVLRVLESLARTVQPVTTSCKRTGIRDFTKESHQGN